MFKLKSLFSLKSIFSSLLCILIIWLLRDYPQWRSERSNKEKQVETKNETSSIEKNERPEGDPQKPIENVSLAHYILVTPFAALYIIGRAIIDAVRFSLYFFLWSCEKSLPFIDDWLFDKVTVWIPEKVKGVEQWWNEKGQPSLLWFTHHLQEHTIPATVENLERFFLKLYQMGCIIQSCTQDFIAAWKRFIERHDWNQLATDLSNIAYIVFWNPSVWIVTRSINLCKLVYSGLYSITMSMKNEIIWLSTVLIPTIYNYIISTKLAKLFYIGVIKVSNGVQWLLINIYKYMLVPTLGNFFTWLVKTIDQLLISLLQSHTIREKLNFFYRWMTPNLVWIILEFSSLVGEIITWAHLIFIQIVYPAYVLFMKHVVPRLAIAYQSVIVKWFYELHLYPTWIKVYPYLNAPLYWMYTHLTLPVVNNLYKMFTSISYYVTQQQLVLLQALLTKVMSYTQIIYSSIQTWLIRQAPILSNMIQASLQLVANSFDWNGLSQEALFTANSLYDWISIQSNMIYLSLERSLTTWAKEQQQQGSGDDELKDKQKLL